MDLEYAVEILDGYRQNNSNFDEEVATAIDIVLEKLEDLLKIEKDFKNKIDKKLKQVEIEYRNKNNIKNEGTVTKIFYKEEYKAKQEVLKELLEDK